MSFYQIKRAIKLWWQRRTRGWDDSELWDLDYTIVKFILPRLKRFRETIISYPGDGITFEDWQTIIKKMERAFELWLEYDGIYGEITKDKFVKDEKLEKEFQEGWDLFCKYFFHLWD